MTLITTDNDRANVLSAIVAITAEKKHARILPNFATTTEVAKRLDFSTARVEEIFTQLYKLGKVQIGRTLNGLYAYVTNV